ALWASIAARMGSTPVALAALAGMATAADAASAAAVDRKPRRVVLVELVIDFLALPEIEGFDGRSRAGVDASTRFIFSTRLLIAERSVLVMAPPSAGMAVALKDETKWIITNDPKGIKAFLMISIEQIRAARGLL